MNTSVDSIGGGNTSFVDEKSKIRAWGISSGTKSTTASISCSNSKSSMC